MTPCVWFVDDKKIIPILWRANNQTWVTVLVIFASISFGTVPFFAKNLIESGIAAPAIAFYHYGLTALALSPFLILDKEKRAVTLWGIVIGIIMGLD